MKPSCPGDFFVESFKIESSNSLIVIRSLRFSISSFVSVMD